MIGAESAGGGAARAEPSTAHHHRVQPRLLARPPEGAGQRAGISCGCLRLTGSGRGPGRGQGRGAAGRSGIEAFTFLPPNPARGARLTPPSSSPSRARASPRSAAGGPRRPSSLARYSLGSCPPPPAQDAQGWYGPRRLPAPQRSRDVARPGSERLPGAGPEADLAPHAGLGLWR